MGSRLGCISAELDEEGLSDVPPEAGLCSHADAPTVRSAPGSPAPSDGRSSRASRPRAGSVLSLDSHGEAPRGGAGGRRSPHLSDGHATDEAHDLSEAELLPAAPSRAARARRAAPPVGAAGEHPPPRTKWTRRVPHPVLIGHAASPTPY